MRIGSSVTSVSWIPSEAVTGMTKLPFEVHRRVVGKRPDDRRDNGLSDAAAGGRPRKDHELERRGEPDEGQAEVGLGRFDARDRANGLDEHDRSDRERRHAGEHQRELAPDPARSGACLRVNCGELGDFAEGGRLALPEPDRRDIRHVERDEQSAGGPADMTVPHHDRGHDAERQGEQRVPAHPASERQRRDEGSNGERDQAHRDVGPDDVAERDRRRLAKRRGDRRRELLGLGAGQQQGKCERADAEAARSRFEMLGEDLGADDDERDTAGERRHCEDRRHRR